MSDQEVETRVAILERDVSQMSLFFDRLDSTMEKLTDISSSIKELLAVHEMKINQHSEIDQEIFNLIEARRVSSEAQHQFIQQKIVESEKDLKKDMDEFQKSILGEMKELRKELKEYHSSAQKTRAEVAMLKYGLYGGSLVLIFILYKMGLIPNIVLP
jgi:hypothetical protein